MVELSMKMTGSVIMMMLALLFLTPSHEVAVSTSTATPIQHVIIIMQENHSFDNYFGTYPTANGTLLDSTTSQLQHVNGLPNHLCLPYQPSSCISPHLTTSQNPSNPGEGQQTYEMDYSNNGTGFPTYSGPESMVYFDYHSIAGYWDFAEEYGLGDNYFAPFLGLTTPNRLMTLSGDTPVSGNYGPPPMISYSQTVMHQLDNAGASWGYYDYINSYSGSSNVYPLNYVSDTPQQALGNIRDVSTLFDQLGQGSGLPSVSYVNSLGNPRQDEHPSSNPTTGELWVMSVVSGVMNSIYWPTTAIFITWDEGGGFYDHVIPRQEFTVDHGFNQPLLGLGQRVPLLAISPYSRENLVSNTLLSHLSLIRFIDYNWKLSPLNALVGQSNLPLEFFNFSQTPRAPLILGPQVTYPIPLQSQSSTLFPTLPFTYGFLSTAAVLAVILAVVTRRRKALP